MINVEKIYSYLRNIGCTYDGAVGIIGNLQGETSDFNPISVEGMSNPNSYLRQAGLTETEYTRRADNNIPTVNGKYFIRDAIGYGIVQWTYWERKQNLLNYAKNADKSIGDLDLQLNFMIQEVKNKYTTAWKVAIDGSKYTKVVKIWVEDYEKPANVSRAIETRTQYAKYWYDYFKNWNETSEPEEQPQPEEKPNQPTVVDTDRRKVVRMALAQLGYREKRTNAQLDDASANAGTNNYTKYARDLDAISGFYNYKKQGQPWCFTAGTLILTDKGYKLIEDITVGDKLLNAYGDRFNNVTAIMAHDADTIEVRSYGALPFRVTPDHPFLAQKRVDKWHRNKGFKDWGFHVIADLNKNDMLTIPKSPCLYENNLSYDDLWIVGYYTGNGNIGHKSPKEYVISTNEYMCEEVEKHIDGRREKMYPSRSCVQYVLHKTGHENLIRVLDDCGVGAEHKRVPKCILYGSIEAKRAFLDGYFAADGCGRKFNTISEELITGVSRLLFDLGEDCSIVIQECPTQGQIFDKRINAVRTFNQKPVIYHGTYNESNDMQRRFALHQDNYVFVPLKYKGEEINEETVYTISTDGDHTYTANNIAVHNCDIFVDWCFVGCYGVEKAVELLCQKMGGSGAGCTYSMGYYRNKKQFIRRSEGKPQVGDQIFFGTGLDNSTHTGLVVAVDDSKVYTVEGNTNDNPTVIAEGIGVYYKSYPLNKTSIIGYGRPNYNDGYIGNGFELQGKEDTEQPTEDVEPSEDVKPPVVEPTIPEDKPQDSNGVYDRRKLIDVAMSQIGYLEKRSEKDLDDFIANYGENDYTKYARDLDAIPDYYYHDRKQGLSWCDIFCDWCFVQAYGFEGSLKVNCQPKKSYGAGCDMSAKYYREAGRLDKRPQVGDQFFIHNWTHTGIVIEVRNHSVVTIEGNQYNSNGKQSVSQKVRLLSEIDGFGHPRYNDGLEGRFYWNKDRTDLKPTSKIDTPVKPTPEPVETEPEPSVPVTGNEDKGIIFETLFKGSKNKMLVKVLQTILKHKGYSIGFTGVDGDFGSATYNALVKFQKNNGINADGICRMDTWKKLFKK